LTRALPIDACIGLKVSDQLQKEQIVSNSLELSGALIHSPPLSTNGTHSIFGLHWEEGERGGEWYNKKKGKK